jgi:hypothetical protein
MMMEPRMCYYIPVDSFDEHGYIPSLVTEGKPGHQPLTGGDNTGATPWYWGTTYAAARETCARVNQEEFGLTPEDALEIVASSMRASFPQEG